MWMTGCRSWYLVDRRGVPATWPRTFTQFSKAMAAPESEDFEVKVRA